MSKYRIATGFPTIDNITGGFRSDDLVLIAGRQGIGTTSFALNILTKNFSSNDICYLTLRDTEETIAERLYVLKESIGVKMSVIPFQRDVVSVTLENTECEGSMVNYLSSPDIIELLGAVAFRKYDYYIIDSLDWTGNKKNDLFGNKKNPIKIIQHLKTMAVALDRPIIVLANIDEKNVSSLCPGGKVFNGDGLGADWQILLERSPSPPMLIDVLDKPEPIDELDNFEEYYSPCEKRETVAIISRPYHERPRIVNLNFFPKTGQFKESTML
jgi:hypothetical protein